MAAPTLLVGIGGTGSDIVKRVYKQSTDKQRANMSFVVFDTDVNELNAIVEETPEIITVQTSSKQVVGEYLSVDLDAKDNWFPVNSILNAKALTEGAGQVRSISRLCMNTTIKNGKVNALDRAIENLYKLSDKRLDQAPRIILTGSLCGGTGSGLVLPIAMYIRNFMTTKLQQGAAIVRGFFLLPEVYFDVIATQSERNNLRCNAYAAIREIDAFLMKADGSLPDSYSDLKFLAPRAGALGTEEFTGRPMDYCFLFDAQNIDGRKLGSMEEYKEHSANCIYAMAIANTSVRGNSSEDNTIRELVSKGGRNRYAGAGSAMLIYPKQDVNRYIALNWIKESISNEWMHVDNDFEKERASLKKRRSKGEQVGEVNRGSHYIESVRRGHSEKRYFEAAIRNQCVDFDDSGVIERAQKPESYVDKVISYINTNVERYKATTVGRLQSEVDTAFEKISAEPSGESFGELYDALKKYRGATEKFATDLARSLVVSLYSNDEDFTNTKDDYRIEYWLNGKGDSKMFMHPNAVRFFLYRANQILEKKRTEEEENLRKADEFFEKFEQETFDLDGDEKTKETLSDYAKAMKLDAEGFFANLKNKSSKAEAIEYLDGQFREYQTKIDNYWTEKVSEQVFTGGMDYCNQVGDAFEKFYGIMGSKITRIDRDMYNLEQKYKKRAGHAVRYVCADETCLKKLAEDAVNQNSSLDIPPMMSKLIYTSMKKYALLEKNQKPSTDSYFSDVYSKTVVKFIEDEVKSQYEPFIEMDVLSALAKEAQYTTEDGFKEEMVDLYVRHAIQDTMLLSRPFIESPIGKEPRIIAACSFSPDLYNDDIVGRKDLINETLRANGGVKDEDMDTNMILFYQAVYDIRANELSKFAPAAHEETYDRAAGDYFTAYHNMINEIHPNPSKSKAITPHIDRWWHIITKMPELDEEYQKQTLARIYRSFFWGMLTGCIKWKDGKETGTRTQYLINKVNLDCKKTGLDEVLIVSNGTYCDHLYELLDSFIIYPKLVATVLNKVEDLTLRNVEDKKSFEDGILCKNANTFTIEEFPLKSESGVRSLFELPLFMKKSVPSEEFVEEDVEMLLDVELEEIWNTVVRFCEAEDRENVFAKFVLDQYRLMIDNRKLEQNGNPRTFTDSLFVYIVEKIAYVLEEEHNRTKDADELREELRKLAK